MDKTTFDFKQFFGDEDPMSFMRSCVDIDRVERFEREELKTWLIQAIYWTGVLYGKQHKYVSGVRSGSISYRYFIYHGLKIQLLHKDVIDSLMVGGRDPFVYRFDKDLDFKRVGSIVLSLIEQYFPGITSDNLLGECSVCEAFTICEKIGIDLLCSSCQEKVGGSKDKSGFVYIAGDKDTGFYKIGSSNDPDFRIKSFNPKLPFKIEIIHQIHSNNRWVAEKDIQKMFSSKRERGEWFSLSDEDLVNIRAIKEWYKGG